MIIQGIDKENELATTVIGCALEVHKVLGPGFLESAYQQCLCVELKSKGLTFQKELNIPIEYKGELIKHGYRIDVLVENCLVLELKAVDEINAAHKAQVLTYLKIGGYKLGLLINFNEKLLKNGLKRIINT